METDPEDFNDDVEHCERDNDLERDEDEWVLDCGLKDCCMPGYHFRHECHTPEMIKGHAAMCDGESRDW